MSTVIPVVMTQLYINSVLHWTLSGLILQHIIVREPASKGININTLVVIYDQFKINIIFLLRCSSEAIPSNAIASQSRVSIKRRNIYTCKIIYNFVKYLFFQIVFWFLNVSFFEGIRFFIEDFNWYECIKIR